MKRFLWVIILVILTATSAYAEMMSVAFSGAEIRTDPSVANSKTVVKVPRYYPVTIVEKGPEYFRVSDVRGRTGWLHKSLLSEQASIVVKGDRANVRQGPGTNHAVLFQLAKGDTAILLSKQGKWVQLQTADKRTGWVADFLVWGE